MGFIKDKWDKLELKTKLFIAVLIAVLIVVLITFVVNKWEKIENPESATCKFMKEYIEENQGITPDTIFAEEHANILRITETSYACNCESSSGLMRGGRSLNEIYGEECGNKCNLLDRPLTKCNNNEDCGFPMNCYKYNTDTKIFDPHEGSSQGSSLEKGVCVLDGSIHHLSELIESYGPSDSLIATTNANNQAGMTFISQGINALDPDTEDTISNTDTENNHGQKLRDYLNYGSSASFCSRPTTHLVKVYDYNKEKSHYAISQDGSTGHNCCIPDPDTPHSQTDLIQRFGHWWDADSAVPLQIMAQVTVITLASVGEKFREDYTEFKRKKNLAAEEGNPLHVETELEEEEEFMKGAQIGRDLDDIEKVGHAMDFRWNLVARGFRWAFFGGRGVKLVGGEAGPKFPGIFKIMRALASLFTESKAAKPMAEIVAKLVADLGALTHLDVARKTMLETAKRTGLRVGEALGGTELKVAGKGFVQGVKYFSRSKGVGRGLSELAMEGGERGAVSVIGFGAATVAGGTVGGALGLIKLLTTGPLGLALGAEMVLGQILSAYDQGGYKNIVNNKSILPLIDKYVGYHIDAMRKLPGNKGPPFGVDIVTTVFDSTGVNLEWPYNKCSSESGNKHCSTSFISNNIDKESAEAFIIIVNTLKEAEADAIGGKIQDTLKSMAEGLKDRKTYLEFLDKLTDKANPTDSTAQPSPAEEANGSHGVAEMMNDYLMDIVKYGYSPTEAIERDIRYANLISANLNQKMRGIPGAGKYLGWVGSGFPSQDPIDFKDLDDPAKISANNTDSPLVYLNTGLSHRFGGIQLTKRGVKLYNRYRNLKAHQEYIIFSKKYLDIEPIQQDPAKPWQLKKGDCVTILFPDGQPHFPGFAQSTTLNEIDNICRYGTEWGKEGGIGGDSSDTMVGDDAETLARSWVKILNGDVWAQDQPFGKCKNVDGDEGGRCFEATDEARYGEASKASKLQFGLVSTSNFTSRMMAYNYNTYMRGPGDDGGSGNTYNSQEPSADYSLWASASGNNDWRSTTPIAYLADPDEAIDDDNVVCNILGNGSVSAYCSKMMGSSHLDAFKYGGNGLQSSGPLNTDDNGVPSKYSTDPADVVSARDYNECVISGGQELAEDILGKPIVIDIEHFFSWFSS